jgi:hypothetical protein
VVYNALMLGAKSMVGAGVGATAGAAAAFNADANNRQLHQIEIDLIKKRARDYAKQQLGREPTATETQAAEDRLLAQAQRDVSLGNTDFRLDTDARNFLQNVIARDARRANRELDPLFASPDNKTGEILFWGNPNSLTDDTIFSAQGDRNTRSRANARIAQMFADTSAPGVFNPQAYWGQRLDYVQITAAANRAAIDNVICFTTGGGCLIVNGLMFRDGVEALKRGDTKLGWTMIAMASIGGGASAVIANQEFKGLGSAARTTFGTTLGRTLDDFIATGTSLRTQLPSSAKTSGNFGMADIKIAGLPETMAASSRVTSPSPELATLGFVGKVDEVFKSQTAPLPNGYQLLRDVDSEALILNNIATRIGSNRNAGGSITLFTERPPCSSCSNIINEFRLAYPNIDLKILHNNGKILSSPKP